MRIELSNIQSGYAEVFIYEPSIPGIEGCVSRKPVRTHLDLSTGSETSVNRWFSYRHVPINTYVPPINTYVPAEPEHRLNGYPTRGEAVQSLIRYYETHCKVGNHDE